MTEKPRIGNSLVLEYFIKHQGVTTRLRERSSEEPLETCQGVSAFVAAELHITETEFVEMLHALKNADVINSTEQVHPFDPTEYIRQWTLVFPESSSSC